jgi:hypothetical protein
MKRTLGTRALALAGISTLFTTVAYANGDTPQKRYFEIYGFAMADAIYDFNRVDPAWDDTLRPSKIPTIEGTFGDDGQASLSVKQSKLGVKGTIPVEDFRSPINFKFEFDFFGVGGDAGQTTIRLRHAYGEWSDILAGQTNSVFMDIDVWPNVIDYWGPCGMVFYRNVQMRWTPYRDGNSHFAVAIERPGNDIDSGSVRQLDPDLGANIRNDEEMPDFTAHYYYADDWAHFQVAGILRSVGFETLGTPDNEPSDSELGWGINLSGHINAFERDKAFGQIVFGEGIASYMNDGGIDLAPDGSLLDPHAAAVPLVGIMLYYDHYWDEAFSTTFGYAMTEVDNTSLQAADAFKRGEYASINLLWAPDPNIMMGGELLWGQRTDNDGTSGDDLRFQFSIRYSFGTEIRI